MRATKRLAYARELLEEIGLEGERLGIFYMSGSQAHAFANAAAQMTERIRRLGPSPLRKNSRLDGRHGNWIRLASDWLAQIGRTLALNEQDGKSLTEISV